MKTCSALPALRAGLLAAMTLCACSSSSSDSSPPEVLVASSTIGPEGGVIVVDSGAQAGLTFAVEPGAVAEPTVFRIVDEAPGWPGNVLPTSYAAPVGLPLRIEPVDLVLGLNAQLTLPYMPENVRNTAPGNVEVMQINPVTTRYYEPATVDVPGKRIRIGVKTLGRFRVLSGPASGNFFQYLPASGEAVEFDGGFAFTQEVVGQGAPWFATSGQRWRIEGPGIAEAIVFDGVEIVGREQLLGGWREVWNPPLSPFRFPSEGGNVPRVTQVTVESPVGVGAGTGSVMFMGFFQFGYPIVFDGVDYRDIWRLSIDIASSRPDLGTGERHVILWCARGVGPLQLSVDGVVYTRLP